MPGSLQAPKRPNVLIVGGFGTVPPNYWPMARRLRARSALVSVAPVWTADWAIAAVLGFGPILRRVRRAIVRAYNDGARQPIIVVAHSGGGFAARLAMSPVPFTGRAGGVAEAVGALVTLGTPHGLARLNNRYRHAGHEAAAFLDRQTPGAFFAPRTRYLTIGSNFEGSPFPGLAGRMTERFFSIAVGDETSSVGDGIVPASAVHLEDAEQLTLDGVRHGMIGSPWYGDEEVIDDWWPTAVRLWQEALRARAEGSRTQPLARTDMSP